MDALVIAGVAGLLAWLCISVYQKFNFATKWNTFYKHFVTNRGYERLLTGMKNTAVIAVMGLFIGIVIGTLIAVIKVIPPYKKPTRYAQRVCSTYVAFFRGTPIVVQH